MSDPKAPPPAAVPVVTRDGRVGYLPAAVAEEAAGHGLRGATDRELRGAQVIANEAATAEALRREYEGTVEGTVLPTLAGAARGLSLGLSDKALAEVGGEVARKKLLDYQAYDPIGSAVGEFGGIVGGALLGDESTLGALPGAVSRLGAGAERFVGSRLGAVGGTLARGAAEGAVFGVGNAVSESALQNKELSAEAVIGGGAHGTLGGMLASGLLHGAGRAVQALRRPGAQAYEAIAAKEFGEAAPGIGRELAEKAKAHPEDVLAADAQATTGPYRGNAYDAYADAYLKAVKPAPDKAKQLSEVFKNREIALNDTAERLEGLQRDFSKAINEQQAAAAVTDVATFGESKVNHMAKLVRKTPEAFEQQANVVMDWMFRAQEAVNTLASDTAVTKLGPAARKEFDSHMARLGKAMEEADSLKLFKAADDMKRFLGRQAEFGRKATGLPEAAKAFDALYKGEGGLMQALESPVWGKAGSAQAAVNAATERHIALGRRFQQGFTTEVDSVGGRPVFGANTDKVGSFMNRLTKAANDLDAQAVSDMIRTRRAFLDATERSYDHGPEALAAIKKERTALSQLEATFNRATKEASLINQAKRLQAEENQSAVGGMLGLALDTASKPMTTLRRLAQIEEHTKKVLDKVSGGSRKLAGAAPEAGESASTKAVTKAGPGFFATLLKDAGKAADLGATAGGAKMMRNEHERRMEALTKLQAQPEMLTKKVGDALGPLSSAAPQTTAAATMVALNGLNFLASKLPMSRLDPFSLTPQFQKGTRASDSEIAQHMRYMEALDNPTGLLDRALGGSLTPDHVEAVKAVYPQIYRQIQTEVMKGLVDAKSELPYGRRIQLGILLDLPTDQTLAPDFVSAIQATYTAAEKAGQEPPPPQLASLDVASSLETATQSAASEGLDR